MNRFVQRTPLVKNHAAELGNQIVVPGTWWEHNTENEEDVFNCRVISYSPQFAWSDNSRNKGAYMIKVIDDGCENEDQYPMSVLDYSKFKLET
jgi:hypothetical protein